MNIVIMAEPRVERVNAHTVIMAEPKSEVDLSAPFLSVKDAVSLFGEKIPAKTQGLPQPHTSHLTHAPSIQYVGTYHGPNHQAEVHQSLITKRLWFGSASS